LGGPSPGGGGPSDPEWGDLWAYFPLALAWSNVGKLQGPQGEQGEPGPVVPLDELLDVSVPAPTDEQVLTWDNAQSLWVALDAQGDDGPHVLEGDPEVPPVELLEGQLLYDGITETDENTVRLGWTEVKPNNVAIPVAPAEILPGFQLTYVNTTTVTQIVRASMSGTIETNSEATDLRLIFWPTSGGTALTGREVVASEVSAVLRYSVDDAGWYYSVLPGDTLELDMYGEIKSGAASLVDASISLYALGGGVSVDFSALPSGGTTDQALRKLSNADGDATWQDDPDPLPPGGTTGQVLTKASNIDQDADWESPTAGYQTTYHAFEAYFPAGTGNDRFPLIDTETGQPITITYVNDTSVAQVVNFNVAGGIFQLYGVGALEVFTSLDGAPGFYEKSGYRCHPPDQGPTFTTQVSLDHSWQSIIQPGVTAEFTLYAIYIESSSGGNVTWLQYYSTSVWSLGAVPA
jgi:hypothetical protein